MSDFGWALFMIVVVLVYANSEGNFDKFIQHDCNQTVKVK